MCSEVAIRVTNLSKCYQIYDKPQHRLLQGLWRGRKQYYREFWALKDVSFEVKRGETVGIIGRNGSGKSTLLQMIVGTLTSSNGTVDATGRISALLELGAGFNPEFTGRENVYMNAAILGLTSDEIDLQYESIVTFAEIGEYIDQPVKIYSSGMFLRLAFAVIAHVDADILVIDEALAVGDAFFTQKCMRFLRKFQETGTVLFVSHDSSAVLSLCTRAVWIDHGNIAMHGEAKTVCEAYLSSFVESIQGQHSEKKISSGKTTADCKTELKDQRLQFINHSKYRNDIELFAFDPNSESFGKGDATIIAVYLEDLKGNPLSWVVGGEKVVLSIRCRVERELHRPIIGFYVKDRLGQTLFGDNTFITYRNSPTAVKCGQVIMASFEFNMPILPIGDYSISTAIADGVQENHIQHHWLHDALLFKSHTSSASTGLIGIPMNNISMMIVDGE